MNSIRHPVRLLIALTLAGLALAGCQTNPITGRSQLMIVSEEAAISSSAQAYAQTMQQAHSKGKLDTNPVTNRRVSDITARLVAQAEMLRPESRGWKWSVHVIEDKAVNAWCMAGGKMAIYSGLLQQIQPSDDEIAQVMGHEISHALLSHTREQMSQAMATQGVLAIGTIASGQDLSGLSNLAKVSILLPFSREAELESDRLGMQIAARAGFDPRSAVTLWRKMSSQGGAKPPEILSTHPSDGHRIAALEALVPQMMPLYQAAKRK